MATQVQLRRGTSAENDAFTGALGEVTVDTTNNTLRVHDGSTAGGFPVAPSSTTASKDLDNLSDTGKANISAQGTYDSGATYNAGTVGKAIQGKANIDMDNLTATGANIANWSHNVSNCITEIPQDINLTLSNGTLTLKAGSKVYVPNGSGVFDVVNITTDKTTNASANGEYMYFINTSGNLQRWALSDCFSGTTAPTSVHYPMWYDTTNNIIKSSDDYGTTWTGKFSLPIAIVTISNGAISSIDQVFNGFGYIGSTVFCLPGVKGLIPNGRNVDGTLKNTALNVSNVITTTFTGTAKTILALKTNVVIEGNGIWYDATNNYIYYSSGSTSPEFCLPIATATLTSGVISNFHPKNNFQAVDYSDAAYLAMPSLRYTDLTLGSTGTIYTAPADGYFTINKAGIDGEWLYLRNTYSELTISNLYSASLNARLFMPVASGQTVQIQYSASGTTNMFRFVYANGVK